MEMMGDGVETRAEMSLMKLACGAQTMDECFVGGRELDARMRARPESSTRIESLEYLRVDYIKRWGGYLHMCRLWVIRVIFLSL
jgi:hypothetical protein